MGSLLRTVLVAAAAAVVATGCGASVDVGGLSACLSEADVAHSTSGPTVRKLQDELDIESALVTEEERIIVVLAGSERAAQDMRDDLQRVLTRQSTSWIGDEGIPKDDEFVVVGNSVVYYPESPTSPDAKAVQRCIGLSPDPGLLSEDPDTHRGEDVVLALTEADFHVFEENQRFSLIDEDLKQQTLEKVDWYTTTIWGKGYNRTEGQMQVFVMATPEAARQLEDSQRGDDLKLGIDEDAVIYIREGNVLVKYYVRAPDGQEWADRSDEVAAALATLSADGVPNTGDPIESDT